MPTCHITQRLIKKTAIAALFLLLILLKTGVSRAGEIPVKIGVLAARGPDRCMEEWSPTAEYLSSMIPFKTFVIIPLDYEQIHSSVEKREVDFILVNSSFYVELEHWYEVNRIATLKNTRIGGSYTTYGGAIFCKANRKDIRNLTDLKGKSFMAFKETSFGGWRMAWRELKEIGIDPHRDFAELKFGGTHDAVVYGVRDDKVDAGTVRTDTLERMHLEGKIDIEDYHFIHKEGVRKEFFMPPFNHSTREYPEWPMAKLKHTYDELAEKVAIALIEMPYNSPAALEAGCNGWTIPMNYQSVRECLKELKVGPYKDLGQITLTDVIRKYLLYISAVAFLLIIMATEG